MKNLFLYSVLCFFINLYSVEIRADETDSLINLKGVVISANKIQVNRNSVPLSISVIDRNEIEASSESALLPVLSERIPGLFVTRKGVTGFGVSSGSAGTINIRGVGQGNKVLVLFDGQPQWAGVFGHALPDTYVASDIERVEVIRGPGSLLYGSNAMGGVINILTRQYDRVGRRTQARVLFGSYNTQKYMVNNGYNSGNLSTYISINHDRSNGHRPDSKFHITNGFGKLSYAINDKLKGVADISLAKYKNQNPGEVTKPILDNTMDILRGTASMALENTWARGSGAIRAFYNWGIHQINDGYSLGGTPRSCLFHSDDHNMGLLVYQSLRLFPGNSFTVGIDYKNWGGIARNDSLNGIKEVLVDRSVNETAGYVIMQQDLFDKISLNAGLRYEHNSVFGGEWIPQAGLTIRPTKDNTLKMSVSKGFRSPNIREMYMFPPQNLDLQPERMMNYEISYGQALLDGRLFAEVTAFYIDGKDMIQVEPVNGRPRNVNTGKFHNKGVEIDTHCQILSNLHLNMNYSYLYTDKVLLAAPKHKYFAGISYNPGRFSVNVILQSIFGLYINTSNKTKEDYTLLNAKVSYRLGSQERGVNLFVKGENLTATKYTINEGFPMPKVLCLGGMEITF